MEFTFKKIFPDYYYLIEDYPNANPIFITVDWRCLQFIKNHHGTCLYCNKHNKLSTYDFSFCYQREVWVLYSTKNSYSISMQIGRAIQLVAANKVVVIPINNDLLSGAHHEH